MEAKLQLQKEISDTKVRLAEIGAMPNDQWTDDIAKEESELNGTMATLQKRWRATENSEQLATQKAEDRFSDESDEAALRLRGRVNTGRHLERLYNGKALDGAEAEWNKHKGLQDHQLDVDLIIPTDDELRTRAATSLPSHTPSSQQGQTVAYKFAPERWQFAGVSRPRVAPGQPYWAFVTAPATGYQLGKSEAVTESAATIVTKQLTPDATQVQVRIAQPDPHVWAAFEGILRSHISQVCISELDQEWLLGTGGLMADRDPAIAAPADGTKVLTWEDCRDAAHNQVDGRYAAEPSDVRFLTGRQTLQKMDQVYKDQSVDNATSGLDIIRQKSGGIQAGYYIPDPASDVQQALAIKGSGNYHVQPLWSGVDVLLDNITQAGKREVLLYATIYKDYAVLDANGLSRVSFKLA